MDQTNRLRRFRVQAKDLAMSDPTFDPFSYIRTSPIMSIETGILLARTLYSAMPKTMPPLVKKAAAKLARVADTAQAALLQRQREQAASPAETPRDIDIAADQVWSALRDILEALSRLPAKYERAQKAKRLLGEVFPEGTGFLRLSYGEQYVTMDTLLKRIDSEGLAKLIDAVVGPELLQEIRSVHPRYEAMLSRRLKDAGPADSLREHLRLLQRSILEYTTAVATTVDSDDPSTIAPAREAFRPIDNYREQLPTIKRPGPTDPADPQAPPLPADPDPA